MIKTILAILFALAVATFVVWLDYIDTKHLKKEDF
jgi:hypothetical protein